MRAVERHAHMTDDSSPVRRLADEAFSRAAGASLIDGNDVRLLKDAAENYPAWLHARLKRRPSTQVKVCNQWQVVRRDERESAAMHRDVQEFER